MIGYLFVLYMNFFSTTGDFTKTFHMPYPLSSGQTHSHIFHLLLCAWTYTTWKSQILVPLWGWIFCSFFFNGYFDCYIILSVYFVQPVFLWLFWGFSLWISLVVVYPLLHTFLFIYPCHFMFLMEHKNSFAWNRSAELNMNRTGKWCSMTGMKRGLVFWMCKNLKTLNCLVPRGRKNMFEMPSPYCSWWDGNTAFTACSINTVNFLSLTSTW